MSEGIDYFGRGSVLTTIQERVSLSARRRMFERWRKYAGQPASTSVLDIGSTPDRERADSNCMIPWLNEAGASVTLYSPENISNLSDLFPFAKIVPAAGFGAPVPVANQSFDWATSSAVLEHVGNAHAQVDFIAECARVARGLFLTTPNRWHWLEFHTKLPYLHWLPRDAHRALLRGLGKEMWAREDHLRLVGAAELRSLARAALGDAFDFEVQSIWALGMPSNLLLLARRRSN
jgi:hypothetical protein